MVSKLKYIAIFIFLASCGDPLSDGESTLVQSQAEGTIMPLAVGNFWRYRSEVFEANENEPARSSINIHSVDSISVYNQKNWFVFFDGEQKKYLRNFGDGLYLNQDGNEYLMIKHPASVNDSWEYEEVLDNVIQFDGAMPSFDSLSLVNNFKVISTDEEIVIDNMIYRDCIEIQQTLAISKPEYSNASSQLKRLYFKEDIGLIREVGFKLENGLEVPIKQIDLIEYKLNR